ncbi:MAG: response regulator [Bdellovibrionota bacterium]
MIESGVRSEDALVLAPTGNDGVVAAEVLTSAGFSARACRDIEDLCRGVEAGCGTVIISEEALTLESAELFRCVLEKQEKWSDLPIVLLTSADIISATELFTRAGNISLLERPFSRLTLIRATEVALRARKKQYEVRNLLRELTSAKIEADRANFAKTQFLANMSHEIRTPIGAIIGFIDLIKGAKPGSADISDYAGVIDRNSQQLLRLIDDILDLSKVEAGKMPIERLNVHLGEFLADLISFFTFKAREKGLAFKTQLRTEIPERVFTDPTRLRQILTNIVGNAIKFTERGAIEFRVAFENGNLKFQVKDTGVGMTSEQAARLFKPFMQADSSTTRKFGGTGLGLVLSQRLSRALGGDLTLKSSSPDGGSLFEISIAPELPAKVRMISDGKLASAPVPREATERKQVLKGLNVLLVEDSPDNQMLISLYLKNSGAQIEVAPNGAAGVEKALESDYDLVLMDVQMPVMDGHEAAQVLRAKQYAKPIIALTAHAMNEEKLKCFASGFTDYLTKPIPRDLLVDVLSRYLPRPAFEAG